LAYYRLACCAGPYLLRFLKEVTTVFRRFIISVEEAKVRSMSKRP
jgi:hypothetical protein